MSNIIICPSCGEELEIDPLYDDVICPYCGFEFSLEEMDRVYEEDLEYTIDDDLDYLAEYYDG